ncbi:MAG: PAS domain S-box protein, partial [Gemmatimonadaceae bacterium]|nr:PAS domain S-box protein [Gemmatimonadaceae bacterium]
MENSATDAGGATRFANEMPFPTLRIGADGTLLYANRGSWLLLSHWSAEIGKPVPKEWIRATQESLAAGEEREIELGIGFKTYLVVLVPVPEMKYVNLFGLDVTRRKQVEQKLAQNAQVFESASEAVMITDPDGRILDVNRAFCEITGYNRLEILGERSSVLKSDRHDAVFYSEMWRSLRERGTWQGEIWDRRKNGKIYPKWLTISAVRDESGA